MRSKKRDEQIQQAAKRIAAAQVELALGFEELLNLTKQTLVGRLDSEPVFSSKRPFADSTTFCIRWEGKSCYLGYTVMFRFFERLARYPDQYVSYDELRQEAWLGDCRSDEAIRSAVRHLKSRLCEAGMQALAAVIQAQRRHYVLSLSRLA